MWSLALVAAIVIGRAISLGAVLRVLGWTAIILAFTIGILALGHTPGQLTTAN
jgi:hypothetical protein